MKNHRFIISTALIGIFISPAMVAAHETNSEPQIKEFIKDSAITAQIKTRLLTEGDIDSLNIKVETDSNGIVMLAGTVKTEAERELVHDIADSVEGVKEVFNNLEIISNQ